MTTREEPAGAGADAPSEGKEMKFTTKRYGKGVEAADINDALSAVVHEQSHYDSTRTLDLYVEKLTQIVSVLVSKLPEHEQIELLNEVSYTKWERV